VPTFAQPAAAVSSSAFISQEDIASSSKTLIDFPFSLSCIALRTLDSISSSSIPHLYHDHHSLIYRLQWTATLQPVAPISSSSIERHSPHLISVHFDRFKWHHYFRHMLRLIPRWILEVNVIALHQRDSGQSEKSTWWNCIQRKPADHGLFKVLSMMRCILSMYTNMLRIQSFSGFSRTLTHQSHPAGFHRLSTTETMGVASRR